MGSHVGMGNKKDMLEDFLHKPGPLNQILGLAEQKTGLDRVTIVYLSAGLLAINLCFGYGAQLVSGGIGFIYPAYESIKALDQKSDENKNRWLTYWVVFSTFHVLEYFSDHLIWWLPVYWFLKTVFLVWCMAPISYNGSTTIYNKVIRPYYKKFHPDSKIDSVTEQASQFLGKASDKMKEMGRTSAGIDDLVNRATGN